MIVILLVIYCLLFPVPQRSTIDLISARFHVRAQNLDVRYVRGKKYEKLKKKHKGFKSISKTKDEKPF